MEKQEMSIQFLGIQLSRRPTLWLLIALTLFLLQVLPYLSCRWLPDESWYAASAYSLIQDGTLRNLAFGPNDVESRLDARPPGTALAMAAAFKCFEVTPWVARIPSVLAGMVIVLLIYLLARKVFGVDVAIISVFVAATDNLIVLCSRSARPEALATMSVLLTSLAMLIYWRHHKASYAFIAGLAMALATMFHVTVMGWVVAVPVLIIFLDMCKGRIRIYGVLSFTVAYLLGILPYAIWLLTAPFGVTVFRRVFLEKEAGWTLQQKILGEFGRYSDFFGFHQLHGNGLEWLPTRLPVPLLIMLAFMLLWRFRRLWFILGLLLLLPEVLWLAYTPNKNIRYLCLLSPFYALIVGAAFAATASQRKLQRVLMWAIIVVVIFQAAANFYLLNSARRADFPTVARHLQAAIPAGEPVYGTITFWMALPDHPYISYERTDLFMAANDDHVQYFITGDNVMVNGNRYGDDEFYQKLRVSVAELKNVCQAIAKIPDDYYGNLEVCRLVPGAVLRKP